MIINSSPIPKFKNDILIATFGAVLSAILRNIKAYGYLLQAKIMENTSRPREAFILNNAPIKFCSLKIQFSIL